MLSFRVEADEARAAHEWAARLGVDRSQILRDALRRHLDRLSAEDDAAAWERSPLTAAEQALGSVAGWGPAEDWSDWSDAAR